MLLATREFAAANRQWRQQLVTRSADEVCAAWVAIRRHCQQLLPVPGLFVLLGPKEHDSTTTRRINDNRLRVKQTKE